MKKEKKKYFVMKSIKRKKVEIELPLNITNSTLKPNHSSHQCEKKRKICKRKIELVESRGVKKKNPQKSLFEEEK